MTGALVSRVLFEGRRAVGVEYLRHGEKQSARAERETILAAGVIGSPHLLMLSGVGDPETLSRHGIAVRAALRGVGQNLQDHMSSPVVYARRGNGPLHRRMRADRIAIDLARVTLSGAGIAGDIPAGAMAFLNSGTGTNLPDLQFLFVAAPMTAGPYFKPFAMPYQDGFACRAILLRPESRGHLELASADPSVPPRIVAKFLATDRDRAVLRAGLRMARDVGRQAALTTVRCR